MVYKGLNIEWKKEGCIREFDGRSQVMDGLWFYVTDAEGKPLEGFDGVYGFHFADNDEAIENYAKRMVDKFEKTYVSYLERKGWDYDSIAARINKLEESEGREVSYHILLPQDKNGKILYSTAKNILGVNPKQKFHTADNQEMFDKLSGFDLIKYAEAEAFGEWKYGDGDILKEISVDYGSLEHGRYETDLLAETIHEMLCRPFSLEDIMQIQKNFSDYYKGEFSYKPLHPNYKETYRVQDDIEKAQRITRIPPGLMQTMNLTGESKEKFEDEVIRLYELIGGTEVYNSLLDIAGVSMEKVKEKYSSIIPLAQAFNLTEETAKGALAGAFMFSSDYLKGTKEYEDMLKIMGVPDEMIKTDVNALEHHFVELHENEQEDEELEM